MLITRAQGAACRRAAERIADGKWDGVYMIDLSSIATGALDMGLEWTRTPENFFDGEHDLYDQSQVLMALLWCAEIAEE